MAKWKSYFLGELGDITSSKRIFQREYVDSGIPFYRTKEVKELANKELVSSELFISRERYEEIKEKFGVPEVGDILITAIGTVGEIYIVEDEKEFYFKDGNILWLKGFKEIDPYFLRYLLSSLIDELQNLSSGSAYKALPIAKLKEYKIPLPPLAEQRRIAAILDKADTIRRKRKQAIQYTEELLRATFLDMFGDPVTNPKGWEIKCLEDFAEIQSGIAKGKKVDASQAVSVPYMRVANVQDGYVDLSEIKELQVRKGDAEKYSLKKGDVLLTEGGDPDKLGRGAVWYGKIEPCIHQNHIFCVRPDYSVAEPEYLSAIIGSEYGKMYFLRAAKQTTGIATINKTQLKKFPVLLPPISLQGEYIQTVTQIRKTRQRIESETEETEKLFSSLLQSAFRGEL